MIPFQPQILNGISIDAACVFLAFVGSWKDD
jgi:hypothetical protein